MTDNEAGELISGETDRPMIIFLHDWGTGPAETLAIGFKAAVNELGKHGGNASR